MKGKQAPGGMPSADSARPRRRRPLTEERPRGASWRTSAAVGLLALAALLLAQLSEWGAGGLEVARAADVDVSYRDNVSAGKLIDGTMHSATLGMDLPYRVYLPPGYNSTQTRYPVLYMLHGGGSGYVEWTEKSHLGDIVDTFISQGRIPPMIVVMPEGDHSYYMNWADHGPRWADYVVYDLVSFVDFTYRTLPERAHRAIGGMSMGGTGALQLAINHPEVFSIVGAHSASLYQSSDGAPDSFGSWDYYSSYDPLRLATTRDNLGSLQIWLDVGDQDEWRGGVELLHNLLASRSIDHQYRLYPGVHDNTFWMNHIPDYLKFYANALAGVPGPAPTAILPPAAASPLDMPEGMSKPATATPADGSTGDADCGQTTEGIDAVPAPPLEAPGDPAATDTAPGDSTGAPPA